MTAPNSRARRRPCRWCGAPEAAHRSPFSACAGYIPIDPTPHGTHQTPRVDLKIPDPDGHAPHWREAAHREGITLGQLCKRLLDAHIRG